MDIYVLLMFKIFMIMKKLKLVRILYWLDWICEKMYLKYFVGNGKVY